MQSSEEIDAAVNLLKASLVSRNDKQITGAVFGEMVRKATPELDIKALGLPTKATFSRFIETYFEGVLFRSHAQGKDSVYNIGAPAADIGDEPDYALWKAFVRPKSKYQVGLIRVSKTLMLLGDDCNPDAGGAEVTVIPSVTQDELNAIMNAFVQVEQDAMGSALPDIQLPYANWTASLREFDRPAYRRWIEFRIDRLLQLFNQRLVAADIDEHDRKGLADFINRSRSARLSKASPSASPKGSANSSPKTTGNTVESRNTIGYPEMLVSGSYAANKDADLRDLVVRAVMNLSIAELRELKLPVGAVADALGILGKK